MADSVKCFKCGQTGHWSRDCTKPPSEWLSRPQAPAAAANAARPSFTPDRAGTAGPGSTQRAAALTPAATGTQPRAQGCYKCGKTGHWARDCTAPPSEQIPRTLDAAENLPPSNATLPKSDAPKKTAPKRKRKIKIRFAELKERDALADVFCNFPERFAKQFRGKGHEVSDLRRLLEMYKIWQKKHFPLHGFDEALDQIADIGKTNQLKMEMREMRQGALKVMQKGKEDAQQQQQVQEQQDTAGEAEGGSGPAEEPAAAQAGDGADWDENDELLAMQQEAWEQEAEAVLMDMLEGGPSAAQRPSASRPAATAEAGPSEAVHALPDQATASQLAEDEDLLALAMEDADEPLRQQPAAPMEACDAAAQQQPSLSQLAEDEELLGLAMEDIDEPPLQQHGASKVACDAPVPQQQPSLSHLAEDEELLALAMEDDEPTASQQQPVAGVPSRSLPQEQASMSQLAEDEELLALAMEDDEPQQKDAAPAEPSGLPQHQQPPTASQVEEDEELLDLATRDNDPRKPSQSQLPTQQKLTRSSTPTSTKQLGRLSRLSQLTASQREQQAMGLEDADEQELALPCDMDKHPSQLPQAAKQAATAEPSLQDSEEEDEEPLVFTRKKQAVLTE